MQFDSSVALLFREALIERVVSNLRALSGNPQISAYGVFVVGSWCTKEPHLMLQMDDSGVSYTSYSDLDLVHREPIPQSEICELLKRFENIANAAGVDKVSLRSATEYEAIPHGATWILSTQPEINVDVSSFLTFWFLVSCTEAIILQRRAVHQLTALHYSLAKSLYALLRNIAFCSGYYPKTYKEINESFYGSGLLTHALLAAAYRTKLGIPHVDYPLLEQFFEHQIGPFISHLPFSVSSKANALIAESSVLLANGNINADVVLDLMVNAAYSKDMRDVIAYQGEKLRK